MTQPASPARPTIEAAILAMAEARGATGSFSPNEVAQALAGLAWRPLLGPVRRAAAALAAAGRIEILRKGKPVPPEALHGVVRLRIRSAGSDVLPP